jgi:hypothetical protein
MTVLRVLQPSQEFTMLPMLLDEAFAQVFVFYWNGKLCKGLRAGNKLYKLVDNFQRPHRDQAFRLGCDLCDKGLETFITVSTQGYRVWVDLQSSTPCVGDPLHSKTMIFPHTKTQAYEEA